MYVKFAVKNRRLEIMSAMPIIRAKPSGAQIFRVYACIDEKTGSVKRVKACTRCIRSGFVKKAS